MNGFTIVVILALLLSPLPLFADRAPSKLGCMSCHQIESMPTVKKKLRHTKNDEQRTALSHAS
jgi:hypothetical protein